MVRQRCVLLSFRVVLLATVAVRPVGTRIRRIRAETRSGCGHFAHRSLHEFHRVAKGWRVGHAPSGRPGDHPGSDRPFAPLQARVLRMGLPCRHGVGVRRSPGAKDNGKRQLASSSVARQNGDRVQVPARAALLRLADHGLRAGSALVSRVAVYVGCGHQDSRGIFPSHLHRGRAVRLCGFDADRACLVPLALSARRIVQRIRYGVGEHFGARRIGMHPVQKVHALVSRIH